MVGRDHRAVPRGVRGATRLVRSPVVLHSASGFLPGRLTASSPRSPPSPDVRAPPPYGDPTRAPIPTERLLTSSSRQAGPDDGPGRTRRTHVVSSARSGPRVCAQPHVGRHSRPSCTADCQRRPLGTGLSPHRQGQPRRRGGGAPRQLLSRRRCLRCHAGVRQPRHDAAGRGERRDPSHAAPRSKRGRSADPPQRRCPADAGPAALRRWRRGRLWPCWRLGRRGQHPLQRHAAGPALRRIGGEER